jgi:Protein of unknown function (DUF1572)
MLKTILIDLYEPGLTMLRDEIEAYSNEADLWKIGGEITNPAGNLCLHICGNLQHFFGAVIGGDGYVRDRDAEFASKNVPRADLLAGIDAALASIRATLGKITDDDFAATYPVEVFGEPMTTGFFLTYLATHLKWHLGQINYHRRLLATK